ncbi:MAG: hypothetical protein FWF73_03985 [Spirochaetes bacterium]|nr:hypothetical protein [Spirochaetota bacterium]
MKKTSILKFFAILAVVIIIHGIIMPCKAYAFDMTAGATTWYAWGDQFNVQKEPSLGANKNSFIKGDPGFLYGPVISAKFNDDFNLTFVFLYGKFDATKKNASMAAKAEFGRIDSDLALNYKLNNYFKVFAGIKYLAYDIIPSSVSPYSIKMNDKHISCGPGIGLSATIPITENVFCLATLSGLYMRGDDKVEATMWGIPHNLNIDYNEYGVNSNLSIAYYISDLSTAISLGARFQYIIANYNDNDIGLSSIRFKMYGVTLSATYTFNI